MKDITCAQCLHLGGNTWTKWRPYCKKYGLNLSGTLERLEKCKKDNGKETK